MNSLIETQSIDLDIAADGVAPGEQSFLISHPSKIFNPDQVLEQRLHLLDTLQEVTSIW